MSDRLTIRPAAEGGVAEAARWYDQREQGLGDEFGGEVNQAIVRVLENPRAFRVVRRRHEVRRVLTHRFPYRIFFSLKGDTVVVHAVSHGHRHDRHWKYRL